MDHNEKQNIPSRDLTPLHFQAWIRTYGLYLNEMRSLTILSNCS